MHNNIMAAGSRDRPPMLATERDAQWQSHFLRYIDTRPNGDALRKCILEGPDTRTTVIIPVVPATDNAPAVLKRTTVETILNMSPENKAHYESRKEAIHLLLTRIGDEIYSTVDACKTAHEMWEAIERLQQGDTLNIQDVKTNLFWEFGKFTSHDGETMESYYFRFVTIVKQQQELDKVSYHKLFDILKKYQKEVNEIRSERIAKNANPLALVAAAQLHLDLYYQAPKSYKSYETTSKESPQTRSHANTKHKGKKIAKPITPPSESASEEDSDPEQAKKDKKMKPKRVKDSEAHYSFMAKIKDVPTADLGSGTKPLEQVQYDARYNVFANERQHSEQPESISNTCVVEKVDSNVIPDSSDMCDNNIKTDQNAAECDDERVALANLIANLKLDLKSTQMKEKVVSNTSQVKFKKTEVEDHHRISSIYKKTKSVTMRNDNLKYRTLNVNAICATCGKCVFNSIHDAYVSKFSNGVNARTKKLKLVPISTRKPKSQTNKSVATHLKKKVTSESTIQNSKSYYRMLYEKTSKAWKWWIEQQCPSGYKWVPKIKIRDGENLDKMKEKGDPYILVGYSTQFKGYHVYNKRTRLIVESIHLRFDEIKEMSKTSVDNDTSGLVPQRQKASDYDNSDPVPQLQHVSPSTDTTSSSQ
nr:Gag-Pol polyprotein [Tanacetum cinerariifolium]